MSKIALQSLIGTALIAPEFCERLLNNRKYLVLTEFDLTIEEKEIVTSIKADSIQEFAGQVCRWLKDQESVLPSLPASDFSTRPLSDELSASELQLLSSEIRQEHPDEPFPDVEAFLVESLAQGLLAAFDIEKPPVPVRRMIRYPLLIFERLNLLELSLGLYDVTYRSLPNGSRVIVVDLNPPLAVQRAGMARELYVAFCRSSHAAKLGWFDHKYPNGHSGFFARCLLMPSAWVRQACVEDISWQDLAERFGVPVQVAAQRLQELRCEVMVESRSGQVVLVPLGC